eukprot:m51a1_g8940 putative inositol hexakisphosphate kinase 3 (269) ;mRNA; f:942150-943448
MSGNGGGGGKEEPADARQVGGHGGELSMRYAGADVLKPATAPREVAFYAALAAGRLPPVLTRRAVCPAFRGTVPVRLPSGRCVDFLVLENVLHDFLHPSVLDIKMGLQTWDDDCSPTKMAGHKEIDARTTTATHGFRVGGMMVYDVCKGSAVRRPKGYGLDRPPEEVLEEFLHDGARVRADVVPTFLRRLEDVRAFFAGATHTLFASSVMFAYDAREGRAEVRLIDFAHAWPRAECPYSDGVLVGLDNLRACWQSVLAKHASATTASQ